MFGLRASRRAVMITAIVTAFVLMVVLARHVIVRAALETAISLATGYEVRFGDQHLGLRHAAFFEVHVIKNGDPVLDASRVDVEYALRDIFPGGEHRFGFAAIAIQKPVLTLTRHADGSLTFTRPGGSSAAPPPATKQAAAPLYFTARVRDGVIRLVDAAPLVPDLAYQTIDHVTIDASVKSDARTTARIDGVLLARHAAGAAMGRYPLSVRSLIDVQRGIALTRLHARELPLRGALGFFAHSPAVRFDDGVIDGVMATLYAVGKPGADFTYRTGATFTLRHGRIAIPAMAKPIRDLHATFTFSDGTLTTEALGGSMAGVPLRGRGALFDLFGNPRFRLAIAGDGDLHNLRRLFGFSATIPLSGPAHLETLLAAQLAKPLIRTWFAAPHVDYGQYPFQSLVASADYYNSSMVIRGMSGRFGHVAVSIGGRADFTDRGNDMLFILNARGRGAELPYTDVFAPDAAIDGTALFEQPPQNGFNARGTILATGPTSGAGTFAVDQRGVGEFGPFSFGRADGSSLAGAFELARPISGSAGWLHLRGFRLAEVRREAALPGVQIPTLPPLAGVVDGDFAAAGTPSTFGLAGTIRGRELRVAQFPVGAGGVTLGGTTNDVRLSDMRMDGPLGRFAGNGAFGNGIFGLEGRYDGTLAQLRPFTADPSAAGSVHGPVRAALIANRIVVQTTGADFNRASLRGVAVDRVAGTLLIDSGALRIVAADGSIGGGHAVAADLGGPFLVSAPEVPVTALRGAGLPLQRGALGLFGAADLRAGGPRFDGIVSVTDGLAGGYPVSGGAQLAVAGPTATIRRGFAGLGGTYGEFAGQLDDIGRSNAYDLNADVPIGDIDQVWKALRLPLRTLYGSFAAQLHIRGSGARPLVDGNVRLPEGSYNGLDFRDAQAQIAISPSVIAAHQGVVTVGSTRARVDGSMSIARRAFGIDVRSSGANLADFNDYFDEAETLDGRGSLAFAFANDGTTTRSSGRIALDGFRYRLFNVGRTDATWSQRGPAITAALNVGGDKGSLRADGTIVPASGDPIAAFRDAHYAATVRASGVDLSTWLPPFHIYRPILGQVDARATVAGRFPRLALTTDATLRNGSLYGYAVNTGTLHARSDGARVAFTDSVLDFGFARFDVNGSAGLASNSPLALSVHGQTANIATTLNAMLPKGPHYDVAGALQADARLTGTLAKPRATVGFEMTQARYASLTIPHVLGSATYDGTTLVLNDAEATFARGGVFVAGSLPLQLQPLAVRKEAPLSFTLALTSLDLAPFAPFVPGPQTRLGGTVDGRLAIEGSLAAPRVVGNLALVNGSYVSGFDRAGIGRANARLSFRGTSVALEALHADVGGGTLDGSGLLDLPFPGVHTSGYAIALAAHGARIDSPQFGRGTIDGTMKLSRGATMPVLGGDLSLSNASIPFAAVYRSSSSSGASGGPPFDLAFNLVAHAGRNVRVQSPIIDIGATGTLDLTGTLSSPKVDGMLTATPGGVFSTYNRAFRVQQATVRFNPADGIVPYIDLRAYAHVTNPDPDPTRNVVGSADITVTVQGPADELASGKDITFTSSPPYSEEQIVGLLFDASLFGAVNFATQQNGTVLRGAPGESNALLPPGVTPYQAGVLSFNQEAFSILNGQFTQRFLAPMERVFIGALNLTDFEVTVDYGGGVGYNVLKQIGHRDLYASFGQRLSYPIRTTVGFTARPNATTSVDFSYFAQNGYASLTTNALGTSPFTNPQLLRGLQPLTGKGGFTFSIVRKYP